jgi:hypothetical protein
MEPNIGIHGLKAIKAEPRGTDMNSDRDTAAWILANAGVLHSSPAESVVASRRMGLVRLTVVSESTRR